MSEPVNESRSPWVKESANLRFVIAWLVCCAFLVLRFYWTALFGLYFNALLLDAATPLFVASPFAILLAMRERRRMVVAAFIPLLVISAAPVLALAFTLLAWTINGFAP
jgi:hypothetical protein